MALAVAQVGGNVTTTSVGATSSFTFGSSTTTNSLIVVVGHTYSTSGSPAAGDFTDNKSNTFQLAGGLLGGASAAGIEMGYNNAGTRGASHQCSFNAPGAGESNNSAGIEITGQDTGSATSAFDSTTFATANDTTSPWSVTSAAAISGNQIAVYGVTIDTGTNTTFTLPGGYSLIIDQGNGATSLVSHAAYKLNETGTPSPGASSSHVVGSGSAREIFATFKEAAGGAAPGAAYGPVPDPIDPMAWMFTIPIEEIELNRDTTPYSTDPPPPAGSDVSVAGWLPAAVHPLATSSADRNLAGIAYVGAVPYSTVSADRSVAGIVHVGAPQLSTISHAATPVGILYTGPLVLTAGGFDYITTGILYATATPMGTVSHTTSVAGLLGAGIVPYSTITHAANVTGLLPAAVTPLSTVTHDTSIAAILYTAAYALNGPSFDYNVAGILYVGAERRTAATADRTVAGIVHAGPFQLSTVTASRTVVGIVELGPYAIATVTRSASVPGLLEVGVFAKADLGPTVTLPGVTDTIRRRDTYTIVQAGTGTIRSRMFSTIQGGQATGTIRQAGTGTEHIQ